MIGSRSAEGLAVAAATESLDAALVTAARRGDHAAFGALVDVHLERTFRTVLAILGDEADARDTTQAIFVRAWRSLPALRDERLFAAWFGRIVVNSARSTLRSRRRRAIREIPVEALPELGAGIPSREAGQDERAAELDRLERAFDRLGERDRSILWLHHYEALPLAEIGVRLGIPAKTVKSRLFTARRALERALEAEDR